MGITITARYLKQSKFKNSVFIATAKREPEAFDLLVKADTILKEMNYETFLPVYFNEEHEYCSITTKFLPRNTEPLVEQAVYNVTFTFNKYTRLTDGKRYVNIDVQTIELLSLPEPAGEVIDIFSR
jgi:hypothetical protein